MAADRQFLEMLAKCRMIIRKYVSTCKFPQSTLYKSRYKRMLREIGKLEEAVRNGILARDFQALEISKMLERNDPEDILESVLELNRYYCDNYRGIKGEK